jgi:hypothetical protein
MRNGSWSSGLICDAVWLSLPLAGNADDWWGIFGVVFAIALVVFTLVWHFTRSSSMLNQWATQRGYRILRQEYCWFFRGPFFWTSSKGQTVYYVVLEDSAGSKRRGWVRCGSWWFGLLSDKVEVRWDD